MSQQRMPADSPVRRFLYACLRARLGTATFQAARSQAMSERLDWDRVVEDARVEGLIPLLYDTVRGRHLVPPAVEQQLQLGYASNAYRNTILLTELEDVLHRLKAEDTPVVLLKGAALAETVYDNAAVRPMIDLDLLVRQKDVQHVQRVLAVRGYEPAHVEPHAGAALRFENETAFRKPGPVAVTIEIHWSLFDSPHYQQTIPLDWFWETALSIQVGGTRTLILGPEAQVLHLCAHVLLHHSGEGLMWLHDVAEVIACYRTQIDWEEVLSRAQTYDLVLPLQQILAQVAGGWHAPIPEHVIEQLLALRPSPAETRVHAWLTAEHRPMARRFWADLASMAGWRRRLRFAWSHLVPSSAYMQRRYDIPRSIFVPLYYPLRWFLGLRSML